MKPWQIVALVCAGVVYGVLQPGQLTFAFGAATLYVFLPPLLFEAAWNLNYRAIVRNWRPIVTLAVPGVVVTALLVAGALAVARVPMVTALAAGAMLSATDPIAVVALFRRVRVPTSLSTIVESEALFNDAVAVVLYRAVLLIATGSASVNAISLVAAESIASVVGGALIGIAAASIVARALRETHGAGVQIVATIASAYGSYFLAESAHGSGIFATIACGIALRYFERAWITLTIVDDVDRFWGRFALLANAVVFFLVGAALHISQAFRAPALVLAALAGIVGSRIVVSWLLLPAGFPREWLAVVRVAGIRGALSLALALALPPSISHREEIIAVVFATVLATLVFSGVTVPPVVSRAKARGRPRSALR